MNPAPPLLYSFRRCPYAIRARMAIVLAEQIEQIELIEIDLKNKREDFLQLSPKGTVPVLKVSEPDEKKSLVIEESLEIMQWAFEQTNPQEIITSDFNHPLIDLNDGAFKTALDHYKYANHYPEQSEETYQTLACEFPLQLDKLLAANTYLTGEKISVVDIAIFPFIRQFSFVNKKWFDEQDWSHLQRWLNFWLEHDAFKVAFAWGRK